MSYIFILHLDIILTARNTMMIIISAIFFTISHIYSTVRRIDYYTYIEKINMFLPFGRFNSIINLKFQYLSVLIELYVQ